MYPAVGKSGPVTTFISFSIGVSGSSTRQHQRVDDLGEVVGRDVGGHAHGDARRAVDEEVRDARGQDDGLLLVVVVVRDEVDGVLVDVGEHLVRDPRHARLGVAHGRRRIAVDGAEVALAVDERVAQGELLDHPHERVVDRRSRRAGWYLPMHVADDARRLLVAAVPRQPEVLHGVEHAPVHGLEAVADVRAARVRR